MDPPTCVQRIPSDPVRPSTVKFQDWQKNPCDEPQTEEILKGTKPLKDYLFSPVPPSQLTKPFDPAQLPRPTTVDLSQFLNDKGDELPPRKKWLMRIPSDSRSMPHLSEKLDDYDYLSSIGKGSYGQVFKVKHINTGGYYALKVLSKREMKKENKMRYLQVESQALQKLRGCVNIVQLRKAFQDQENCYLVMELAENGSLQDVLDKYVALQKDCARVVLAQILCAISCMHTRGIVHRDLKPENVLLDERNVVKVTDFGTARLFGDRNNMSASKGSFVGSPDYVAPEVLQSVAVSPECDLWAFGCIAYTIFAGEAPFHTESGSHYSTFQKILSGNLEMREYVPDDVQDLVSKLLKQKPEERLGHGEVGADEYDCYKSIKDHKFFNGIDWKSISKAHIDHFESFQPAYEMKQALESERKRQEMKREQNIMGETVVKEVTVTWVQPDGDVKTTLCLTNRGRIMVGDMESDPGDLLILDLAIVMATDNENILTLTAVNKEYKMKLPEGRTWRNEMPELFSM